MGLYDRDYGRDYGEATPWDQHQQAQKPKSITIILIVITVAVFLIGMFMPNRDMIADWFAVRTATLTEPWTWWQFVTYGFVHDPNGINHILFNMIGLFFFSAPSNSDWGTQNSCGSIWSPCWSAGSSARWAFAWKAFPTAA